MLSMLSISINISSVETNFLFASLTSWVPLQRFQYIQRRPLLWGPCGSTSDCVMWRLFHVKHFGLAAFRAASVCKSQGWILNTQSSNFQGWPCVCTVCSLRVHILFCWTFCPFPPSIIPFSLVVLDKFLGAPFSERDIGRSCSPMT